MKTLALILGVLALMGIQVFGEDSVSTSAMPTITERFNLSSLKSLQSTHFQYEDFSSDSWNACFDELQQSPGCRSNNHCHRISNYHNISRSNYLYTSSYNYNDNGSSKYHDKRSSNYQNYSSANYQYNSSS
ncbi:unnamed protein product [Gadus morhua 'NCC']